MVCVKMAKKEKPDVGVAKVLGPPSVDGDDAVYHPTVTDDHRQTSLAKSYSAEMECSKTT